MYAAHFSYSNVEVTVTVVRQGRFSDHISENSLTTDGLASQLQVIEEILVHVEMMEKMEQMGKRGPKVFQETPEAQEELVSQDQGDQKVNQDYQVSME